MLSSSTKQIYLPNYKVNITVPADYSGEQIDAAIQRNKAQIQKLSPVFVQSRTYLQNALGPEDAGDGVQVAGLGITEAQGRVQGVGPAVQSAEATAGYRDTDQRALLRHYAAQKAINSANQHPRSAQIVQKAQANLLPSDRLTAIGDRATRAVTDVIQTPLLNHVLDYGAPGASQQLEKMQGFGAGLARGVLGFSSPLSLGAMAALGPMAAEPMGAKMLLGAFGTPAVTRAYQQALSGDIGGAMGELTAFGLPIAFHGPRWAQEAINAAEYRAGGRWMDENYGVDADPLPLSLLPPGPDANIYDTDLRHVQPASPFSTESLLPVEQTVDGRPTASSHGIESFPIDPTELRQQPSEPFMPASYTSTPSTVSSNLNSDYSSSTSYGSPMFNPQNRSIVNYQPVPLMSANDLGNRPTFTGLKGMLQRTLTLVPSTPLHESLSDSPLVPFADTQNPLSYDQNRHPFSVMIPEPFANGRLPASFSEHDTPDEQVHKSTYVNDKRQKIAQKNFSAFIERQEQLASAPADSYNMAPEDNNDPFDRQRDIRWIVEETLAKGHLSDDWYHDYLRFVISEHAYFHTTLSEIFQGETLKRAEAHFKDYSQVLQSPVTLNDRLPNTIYGTVLPDENSPSGWKIVLNGRLALDPEDVIFIIAEEAVHIAQRLRGMEIDNSLPYEARPHEKEAKLVAHQMTGRTPFARRPMLTRELP
jgi:hypothetical protein